jgi:carbamoyltransferase
MARTAGGRPPVEAASAVQRRIAELLLELAAEVRVITGCDRICLGGGLFHNTFFTTAIRTAGLFAEVFVPINPGNAGLALGAALLVACEDGAAPTSGGVSPFLGPEYDETAIKDTLDGCKLSYAFVREGEALDQAVDALARGALVGWFEGRMEWGPRALGHRCILASPHSPYVLDNLNGYLRKRERWRAFGISVTSDAVPELVRAATPSPFMQFEFEPCDDRLRHAMPAGATSIRVQTVGRALGSFWELHRRVGQATGTPALVNTSLNGFHEPIACTPGDAVRVFYGTGLDMLVMGRFILRK